MPPELGTFRVYVLPWSEQGLEDFQWIRREVVDGGGEAYVFRAACVEGIEDEEIRAADPALRAIADLVHDLDLKDARYGRPEAAGIGALLSGIAASRDGDEDRIQAASRVLDALRTWFEERS